MNCSCDAIVNVYDHKIWCTKVTIGWVVGWLVSWMCIPWDSKNLLGSLEGLSTLSLLAVNLTLRPSHQITRRGRGLTLKVKSKASTVSSNFSPPPSHHPPLVPFSPYSYPLLLLSLSRPPPSLRLFLLLPSSFLLCHLIPSLSTPSPLTFLLTTFSFTLHNLPLIL